MNIFKRLFGSGQLPAQAVAPPLAPAASKSRAVPAITNDIGMSLVYIPAGDFVMGSPREEVGRGNDEAQRRVVIAKPFRIAATPVTQMQWRAMMGTDPAHFNGKGNDLPVENVSWHDAVQFCLRLSDMDGKSFRLPTEAEWEYACRAGSTGAYGGTGKLDDMAWYNVNGAEKSHPVCSKQPNAWGIYDMHGNVSEWCSDWYGLYPREDSIDPKGPAEGKTRIVRGGSWSCFPARVRSARRGHQAPETKRSDIGFRVCRVET